MKEDKIPSFIKKFREENSDIIHDQRKFDAENLKAEKESSEIMRDIKKFRKKHYSGNIDTINQGEDVVLLTSDVESLYNLIEKNEIIEIKTRKNIVKIANREALLPTIGYDAETGRVKIVQGRHRIVALHNMGFKSTQFSCLRRHTSDILKYLPLRYRLCFYIQKFFSSFSICQKCRNKGYQHKS